MSRSRPVISQRPSSSFCWLPPLSRTVETAGLEGRTPILRMQSRTDARTRVHGTSPARVRLQIIE